VSTLFSIISDSALTLSTLPVKSKGIKALTFYLEMFSDLGIKLAINQHEKHFAGLARSVTPGMIRTSFNQEIALLH
jgi:hypothetical protein